MNSNVVKLSARRRNFLSVTSVYPNDPFFSFALDLGCEYEFIPDIPGVLVLIGEDGRAISVEACDRSMRKRAIDCWVGRGGVSAVGAVRIGFEASLNPGLREKELVEEHRLRFGVLPAKNRA